MPTTQRFGFNYFGGIEAGSIGDDGYKFTDRDRRLLDRLLAAMEVHNHAGGDALANPDQAPAAALQTTGGSLLAGTTYHYRVAYVDDDGLETAASDEVSVATPGIVAVPNPPGLAAVSGGQLGDGVHQYGLTAIDAGGQETQLSVPGVITLTDWRSVAITWTAPEGASQIGVWREGPTDGGFTRIATVAAADGTFTDDGSIPSDDCPCDPDKLPPATNRTNATNAVELTLPDGVASNPLISAWRIYRTTTSGVYEPSSLVAEVVQTTDETGTTLSSTYVDTGDVPQPGQPLDTSQVLQPSPLAVSSGGGTGGAVVLAAPGGQSWRVLVDADGVLVTRQSDAPGMDIVLTDAGGTLWQLAVDDAGALETSVQADALRSFAYDEGPQLPTADPTVHYMLRVATGGVLETVFT